MPSQSLSARSSFGPQLALALDPLKDVDLSFAQQLGVGQIVAQTTDWGADNLARLHNRVEKAGLHLAALEALPVALHHSASAAERDGDREIDRVCEIIRGSGRAGIPLILYQCVSSPVQVLATPVQGRGRASSQCYPGLTDRRARPAPEQREAMWRELTRLLLAALPVAESAQVKLAFQPAWDSPQSQILDKPEDVDRLLGISGSGQHGLDMDHAFWGAWFGESAGDAIARLCQQGRILAAQVRQVRTVDGALCQGFLDEDRETLWAMLLRYRKAGYCGPLRPAPVPAIVGDTASGHRGYAFCIGYLRAFLQALA